MLISSNWADLLDPGLRKLYDKHIGQLKDNIPALFNVEKSTKAAEYNLGFGALGTMDEWSSTGSQVSYEDIAKGYKSTYTHKKYSKGVKVERELVDDDQYGEIKKRVRNLAQSVWYTRQTQAAGVFNGAFTGVGIDGRPMVGPDGLPLCSAAHPVAPSSATTYANAGVRALTADNVEATRTAMLTWQDDKGNLLAMNPDCIVVPPSLRKAALVIADSPQEPSTTNNDINIWKGSLMVIEWPFLTDTNAWFMCDKQRQSQFLNWYDRRVPSLEADRANFDDESAAWKTVGRWSFGWDDASFIYGNNPS